MKSEALHFCAYGMVVKECTMVDGALLYIHRVGSMHVSGTVFHFYKLFPGNLRIVKTLFYTMSYGHLCKFSFWVKNSMVSNREKAYLR